MLSASRRVGTALPPAGVRLPHIPCREHYHQTVGKTSEATVGSTATHWLIGFIIIAGLATAALFWRRGTKPVDPAAEWEALNAKKVGEGLTAEEEARLKKLSILLGISAFYLHRQPGDDKGNTGFDVKNPKKTD